MKIVLATNNAGKIKELSHLFQDLAVEFIPQSELGVTEIEETGLSFIENALIKARHAAHQTGLWALADDSGLAVAALHGAPGIRSARYAGDNASMPENIEKLLNALKPYGKGERQAVFHCALALVRDATDPIPLIAEGQWQGEMTDKAVGTEGFGYDPVFYVPSHGCTAAELPLAEKNRLSHRAKALSQLHSQLKHVL